MSKKYTALALQGGGALGAYEYGVVKALYEQKNFEPDIITGVSIGAFSAAVLAGSIGHPIDALGRLWQLFTVGNKLFPFQTADLGLSLTYNPGMYFPNPYAFINPALVTHFFDTTPLYRSLAKVIDLKKLNSKESPHLVISATNVKTGELEYFDNRKMDITFDHIVASGSLPPSFPMTKIGNKNYWDGGLFSNTPLKPAVKLIEKLGDSDSQRQIILVELFPNRGRLPNDMPQVFDRVVDLVFASKLQLDTGLYQRTSDYIDLVEALEQELPPDSKAKQLPAYKKLLNYQKIHQLTIIENTSPPYLVDSADFTQKTIDSRISRGYKDGRAYVVSNTLEEETV